MRAAIEESKIVLPLDIKVEVMAALTLLLIASVLTMLGPGSLRDTKMT